MSSPGYEEVEHTADLALHVWGEDFFSLLDHSAKGMYHLIGVSITQENPVEWSFTIENQSDECVLVDFLNELLYFCEDRSYFFDDFQYVEGKEFLEIAAKGFKLNRIQRSIKAVTFHYIDIRETDLGFETTITFDV